MSKNKNILWDAERLAALANASDRQAAEGFRAKHKDFLPDSFWTEHVKSVARNPSGIFGADISGVLLALGLSANAAPLWAWVHGELRIAWRDHFPLEECVRLIALNPHPIQVWPYQRAVMFLAVEPWRARFCAVCGKRFVADKPPRRFCSPACSGKARQATRAKSWKRHGESWRSRYESKKASRKRNRRVKR